MKAVCQFVVLLLSMYCIFFYFYPWFFLCFWQLCPLLCHPPHPSTEWWRKKNVCHGLLFVVLIHCHWCQEVLSSHWLVSWCGARCQFTSHCELKSSIWFWEEYIHFEWIYKVFRFDPFSSNFGIMLQGCWQIKVCWEILMFEIFVPWHPFIQHASRLF